MTVSFPPTGLDIRSLAAELGGTGVPLRWEELDWPSVPSVVEHTRAAIIPIGAVEQHGPHLPMNVDTEIDTAVTDCVSAVTGIPVIPPVSIGVSASHGDFPGTLTLSPETLIAVMQDLTDSLYRSGVRQFIFISGHIWNNGALDVSIEKLRTRYPDVRARSIGYVTMYPGPEVNGRVNYGRGLMHANFFETSVMLHLRPDLVRMDRVVSHSDRDSFWDYRMDQVSDSGVWGNEVGQANAEHGRAEFDRCVERTARALAAAIREPEPERTR
ncbi:creatininase family protein [Demequina sp. NBRC 110051]|uniref:creatininase family protein n=1 Tax=Demequina sp. NBRC 110051 TaxID=1570340 RepID=UPI000A04CDFB|nr:creatininase family protein [Demequina sp. NBRC 110051]